MAVLDLVLFLGAALGHTALLIFCLNRCYALAWPRPLLKLLRLGCGCLILGGPALLWLHSGWQIGSVLDNAATSAGDATLALYLCLCWLIGLILAPAVTVLRALRGQPAVQVSNHTRTVNIAAELGSPPAGVGKHAWMTRLPRNEVFQVDFSERTLSLPYLPQAWDGLTILHVSDLHLCGSPGLAFFQSVMDRCAAWEPDLVAVTGDIVDSAQHHEWIEPVFSRLRWRYGAYAILGNHDSWNEVEEIRRRLGQLGLRVLGNSWEHSAIRGEPLVVIGHEGPWFRPEPDLTACPVDGFRLCLSHTPDHIAWARRHGVDLMLAGHNHGGQIRFPLIGSVFVPSIYGRAYDCGTFDENPTVLHVSRGLSGREPLRYNCRPEVTLLVLKAVSKELKTKEEIVLPYQLAEREAAR